MVVVVVVLVAQFEFKGTPLRERLCVVDELLAFSKLSNGLESVRRLNVVLSPEVEVVRRLKQKI